MENQIGSFDTFLSRHISTLINNVLHEEKLTDFQIAPSGYSTQDILKIRRWLNKRCLQIKNELLKEIEGLESTFSKNSDINSNPMNIGIAGYVYDFTNTD